jgi:hypothetical protein
MVKDATIPTADTATNLISATTGTERRATLRDTTRSGWITYAPYEARPSSRASAPCRLKWPGSQPDEPDGHPQ